MRYAFWFRNTTVRCCADFVFGNPMVRYSVVVAGFGESGRESYCAVREGFGFYNPKVRYDTGLFLFRPEILR